MIYLVSHLPSALLVLLFVGGFSLVGLVCHGLVQKWCSRFLFTESTDIGEIFEDAAGAILSLLFALVSVAVWQNHDRVDGTVSSEANVLHNLYRNLEQYPPDLRASGQAKLKAYVRRVAEVEWVSMTRLEQDPEAHRLITELNAMVSAYRPASVGEVPLHTQTLDLVSTYRTLRHDRLRGAEPYLDLNMWTALILGAGFYIVYSSFYKPLNPRAHRFMMASLGAALGLVFYIMVIYNYTFSGPEAISPRVLLDLEEQYWRIQ